MTDTVSAINYIKSYRKLDENLHKCAPKGSIAYYSTKLTLEYWDMAIQALEQTQWIPVSERLPNRDEYIASNGLFIVSDGNRSYAEYFDMYDSQKYFGEPTMEGFKVDRCVTKWMPLPSCYEPQESEG